MSLLFPQVASGSHHASQARLNPWPSVTEMLRVKRSGIYNIGRRLKTSATLLQARTHRPTLASAFAEMQWAAQLFQKHPALFKTVLDQYLDLRHGMAQRFHLVAHDLRQLHERREQGRLLALLDAERLTLWQDDALGLMVAFDINLQSPQEGLWRLTLRQIDTGRHVYSLSFAIVRHRAFVGAIQGVKGEDGQDLVRSVTRTLHGVRPHFFLIEVLRQLAGTWGAQGLVGVGGCHQLKACKHSDDSHLVKFDYAAFWQELGGERNEHGHWDVPLQGQRKDMADIESKKRSMYRKRYAMLDALAATVAARA
jgi:uncharacterized protein VirK/YbjX